MNSPPQRLPVVIQVGVDAIQRGDCSRETSILHSFVPDMVERNRNRVLFEVMGYQHDPREIYEIPEVRNYFQKLFAEYPGLFFWISTDTHMFSLLAVLLYPLVRTPGGVSISPQDMGRYVAEGFRGLNEFCAKNGLDPNPTTAVVLAWTQR